MSNEEIFELMARFERSGLSRLKLSKGDFKLELERVLTAAPTAPRLEAAPPADPVPATEAKPADGSYITAPLVGTFYLAPEPGAEPFVQVGAQVKKGQTVALLEAMKMMSEVQAPCDCIIEEILPEDGALVSFGEALIRYREG